MGIFTLDPIEKDESNIERMREEIRNGSYKNTNEEITFKLDKKIVEKLKKYSMIHGISANDALEEIISDIHKVQDIDEKFKRKFKDTNISSNDNFSVHTAYGLSNSSNSDSSCTMYNNPSTGLPMTICGVGGVDTSGTPYGISS